jgi:hypothetical protein
MVQVGFDGRELFLKEHNALAAQLKGSTAPRAARPAAIGRPCVSWSIATPAPSAPDKPPKIAVGTAPELLYVLCLLFINTLHTIIILNSTFT